MKMKILMLALVVVGLSACTQKTCPTYANNDVNNVEKVAENV
jgi:hypothetical protein